jgi:integrase
MTGRPPLPIGAHGTVAPPRQIRPGVFEARCRYRDADGVTRIVKRTGKSASAARNALLAALAERRHTAGAGVNASSRMREAANVWLAQRRAQVDAGDLAPRTLQTYESAWRLHVEPALGDVRLREATPARCEAWLVALRKKVGPSTCAHARAVLSGVLGYAARMDAIGANPVRDLSPIPGAGKRTRKPRAMTKAERTAWLAWLDNNVAHNPDLPKRPELYRGEVETIAARALGDITRLQLATGARIGEVMALSWDDVDLEQGTVAIRHHLVRLKGRGLYRQPGAKSEAGDRVLRLPSWGTDMLLRRRVDNAGAYPVFPDVLGGWRDPNLVMRWLRWSRELAGFGWVTSHVFRQTVITELDAAGLSTREVADQAGHSRVAQTQGYMARGVASDAAAAALEAMI